MTTPIPLATQVGGHDGVLSSADGSVVIKPCLPLEIEFYTALSSNDAFAHLLPHVPKFYGTLKLHGRMDEHGNIGAADAEDEETGKDEHVVLWTGWQARSTSILDDHSPWCCRTSRIHFPSPTCSTSSLAQFCRTNTPVPRNGRVWRRVLERQRPSKPACD